MAPVPLGQWFVYMVASSISAALCYHAPQLPHRLPPLPDVGQPRGSQRHSRVVGRRRLVTRVAPHGPRRDSLPSHPKPDTRTRPTAKACSECCAAPFPTAVTQSLASEQQEG